MECVQVLTRFRLDARRWELLGVGGSMLGQVRVGSRWPPESGNVPNQRSCGARPRGGRAYMYLSGVLTCRVLDRRSKVLKCICV